MIIHSSGTTTHARGLAENPHLYFIESEVYRSLNVTDIAALIGSLGFPIVMCLYITVTMKESLDKLQDAVLSLSTRIDTLLEKRG